MAENLKKNSLFSYTPCQEVKDAVNQKLLEELQCDPRLSMSELGRRVKMSTPAVIERVRRLEESGVIRGFRLEVNPAALGLPLAAYVRIRPNPGQLQNVAELAARIPEIVECHRITGEDCFILKVYLPAIDQLDRILDSFLVFGSTTTSIVQSSPVPLRPLPISNMP
jgi:Lrp/AsnC family transcriptional regulator, leucine-responsive regulatory protein